MDSIYTHRQKIKLALKTVAFVFSLLVYFQGNSQILMFPSNVYIQNFGTSDILSWADNSTFSGWYIQSTIPTTPANIATFNSHINVLGTNIPGPLSSYNSGDYFSFECNSTNDQKIGTRPSNGSSGNSGTTSGSSPAGVTRGIYVGARFKNNTPTTCTGIKVTYSGFQMSLAENNNAVNKYLFSYQISASPITNLITTGWTAVASLDYTAPNNDAGGTSNQLQWYACNVSSVISGCLMANVPPGSEVMLRWQDSNDANNDPYLAIDDVQVEFFSDNVCLTLLPIDLIDFYATQNGAENDLIWKVATEKNVAQYIIEKSEDGIHFTEMTRVIAKAKQGSTTSYSCEDNSPYSGITYYRLNTLETDGEIKRDQIIYLDRVNQDWESLIYQQDNFLHIDFKNSIPKNSTISLFDLSGKLLVDEAIKESQTVVNTQNLAEGIYFIRITNPYKTENFKLIIQK